MFYAVQLRAQELDLRLLGESPEFKEATMVVFSNHISTLTLSRDSIDLAGHKMFHFNPMSVSIDTIIDTITIWTDNFNYFDYKPQILQAYSTPDKEIISTDNTENVKDSWFSFRETTTKSFDSTKIIYISSMKVVDARKHQENFVISKFNYLLLCAWIFLVLSIIINLITKKWTDKISSKRSFTGVCMIIWCAACVAAIAIIIFSWSVFGLMIIAVIAAIWKRLRKKKAELKASELK
jgi:hypothetical protein